MIKYCLPVIEETTDETIACVQDNLSQYSYFEIWLDYIRDGSPNLISRLIESFPQKLIFLLRRKNLETPHLSAGARQEILKLLVENDCLLDLDITQQESEIQFVKDNDLSIRCILSYHNYQSTPCDDELRSIVKQMEYYSPEIYKISCYCQSRRDTVRLLNLLLELKESGKKCIVLGMGEHSHATRIFGSLWGNELIFAPVSLDKASAPGQLTRKHLETIYTQLK